MTVTALSGPIYSFGQAPTGDYNPDIGPSLFFGGAGLMDPRAPFTYSPGINKTYGWTSSTSIPVISQVPSTLAINNIAVSAVPVSGTPFTLVSTTGAGITAGVSITRADTGATVTGLLAIDGAMGSVTFGKGGTGAGGPVNIWDATKAISRCVRVISAGNDSTGTFLISGYDIYGYPMSQLLTGASGAPGTATTTKAFKYIASVLPGGTMSGSAITVGTTDVYGFPIRSDYFGEVSINWNSTVITANTGFTAAVTTSPSTNLLGDVRGTYATQSSASDGTKRMIVLQTPSIANIGTAVGLYGVSQV